MCFAASTTLDHNDFSGGYWTLKHTSPKFNLVFRTYDTTSGGNFTMNDSDTMMSITIQDGGLTSGSSFAKSSIIVMIHMYDSSKDRINIVQAGRYVAISGTKITVSALNSKNSNSGYVFSSSNPINIPFGKLNAACGYLDNPAQVYGAITQITVFCGNDNEFFNYRLTHGSSGYGNSGEHAGLYNAKLAARNATCNSVEVYLSSAQLQDNTTKIDRNTWFLSHNKNNADTYGAYTNISSTVSWAAGTELANCKKTYTGLTANTKYLGKLRRPCLYSGMKYMINGNATTAAKRVEYRTYHLPSNLNYTLTSTTKETYDGQSCYKAKATNATSTTYLYLTGRENASSFYNYIPTQTPTVNDTIYTGTTDYDSSTHLIFGTIPHNYQTFCVNNNATTCKSASIKFNYTHTYALYNGNTAVSGKSGTISSSGQSITFSGLSAGTTYTVKTNGKCSMCSNPSSGNTYNAISFTTSSHDASTNTVSVTSRKCTSITISAVNSNSTINGYTNNRNYILYDSSGNTKLQESGYKGSSHEFTGLTPGTTYKYQVIQKCMKSGCGSACYTGTKTNVTTTNHSTSATYDACQKQCGRTRIYSNIKHATTKVNRVQIVYHNSNGDECIAPSSTSYYDINSSGTESVNGTAMYYKDINRPGDMSGDLYWYIATCGCNTCGNAYTALYSVDSEGTRSLVANTTHSAKPTITASSAACNSATININTTGCRVAIKAPSDSSDTQIQANGGVSKTFTQTGLAAGTTYTISASKVCGKSLRAANAVQNSVATCPYVVNADSITVTTEAHKHPNLTGVTKITQTGATFTVKSDGKNMATTITYTKNASSVTGTTSNGSFAVTGANAASTITITKLVANCSDGCNTSMTTSSPAAAYKTVTTSDIVIRQDNANTIGNNIALTLTYTEATVNGAAYTNSKYTLKNKAIAVTVKNGSNTVTSFTIPASTSNSSSSNTFTYTYNNSAKTLASGVVYTATATIKNGDNSETIATETFNITAGKSIEYVSNGSYVRTSSTTVYGYINYKLNNSPYAGIRTVICKYTDRQAAINYLNGSSSTDPSDSINGGKYITHTGATTPNDEMTLRFLLTNVDVRGSLPVNNRKFCIIIKDTTGYIQENTITASGPYFTIGNNNRVTHRSFIGSSTLNNVLFDSTSDTTNVSLNYSVYNGYDTSLSSSFISGQPNTVALSNNSITKNMDHTGVSRLYGNSTYVIKMNASCTNHNCNLYKYAYNSSNNTFYRTDICDANQLYKFNTCNLTATIQTVQVTSDMIKCKVTCYLNGVEADRDPVTGDRFVIKSVTVTKNNNQTGLFNHIDSISTVSHYPVNTSSTEEASTDNINIVVRGLQSNCKYTISAVVNSKSVYDTNTNSISATTSKSVVKIHNGNAWVNYDANVNTSSGYKLAKVLVYAGGKYKELKGNNVTIPSSNTEYDITIKPILNGASSGLIVLEHDDFVSPVSTYSVEEVIGAESGDPVMLGSSGPGNIE